MGNFHHLSPALIVGIAMSNGPYYAMVGGLALLILLALGFCVWVYWPTKSDDEE